MTDWARWDWIHDLFAESSLHLQNFDGDGIGYVEVLSCRRCGAVVTQDGVDAHALFVHSQKYEPKGKQ